MADFCNIVSYGVVTLKIVKTNILVREVQMSDDGIDYINTKFILDVDCVFNPFATAYLNQDPPVVPNNLLGAQMPALTDAAIRDYLAQPRRTLIYRDAGSAIVGGKLGQIIFQSPQAGYPCDSRGGPTTEDITVKESNGYKTWKVHIRFNSYVVEVPAGNAINAGQGPIVLSNRWTMRETIDWQLKSIRTIRGKAIFNRPMLENGVGQIQAGSIPDDFRKNFNFPIPGNVQRTGVVVEPNSDGNQITYEFTDEEKFFQFGPNSPVVRAEGRMSLFLKTGKSEMSSQQNAGLTALNFLGPLGMLTGWALSHSPTVKAWNIITTSTYYAQVILRLWGGVGTTRKALTDEGIAMIIDRLGDGVAVQIAGAALGGGPPIPTVNASLTHDLLDEFVELQCIVFSPPGNQANLFSSVIPFVAQLELMNESTDGIQSAFDKQPIGNPAPPLSNATRSTLKAMISQILTSPHTTPPPVNDRFARDETW